MDLAANEKSVHSDFFNGQSILTMLLVVYLLLITFLLRVCNIQGAETVITKTIFL